MENYRRLGKAMEAKYGSDFSHSKKRDEFGVGDAKAFQNTHYFRRADVDPALLFGSERLKAFLTFSQ